MKSTKKKLNKWNQHTFYIIKVIYIDFQAGKKEEKKITQVQLRFELGTLALPTELNSPIHITRKAKKRFCPFAITTFNWKFDHVPDTWLKNGDHIYNSP